MKIELAKHSGFCVGVRNAVNKIVKEINNCDDNILIHGPLIHSPQTVEILEKRGLKIIKNDVNINNQIVAIRTHGIPRQEYKEIKKNAKRIINLTCSNVAHVQGIVKKYSLKGYFTIILGDKNHAEVKGISSYASGKFFVVSSTDDIINIPDAEKYILVSQTTLDFDFFYKTTYVLKEKYKNIVILNTICNATDDRQTDLLLAVKNGVDAIIVVGGKNSANTKRLVQIGAENNVKTFHIETEDELNHDDFTDVKYVIITAGASTPSWIINNVLEKVYEINFRNKTNLLYLLKSFIEFIIRTNIFSAIITIIMTLTILPCRIYECNLIIPLVSSAFIFLMYSINNLFRPFEMKLSKPFKYNLYKKHKYLLIILTFVALIYYLYYSLQTENKTAILYSVALVSGFIYAIPKVAKIASNNSIKLVRIIFGIKSVVTSIGWVFVALVIPFIIKPYNFYQFLSIFLIIFSIVFIRNLLLDLIDYHGDLLLGIETFPTIFGINITKTVIISLCILYVTSIIYNMLKINPLSILYLINMIYYYFIYKKIKKKYYFYILKYEFLIDLNLLLFALFATINDFINPLI